MVFGILVLVLGLGVQLSCLIADAVTYQGADLLSFKAQVIAFVVIVVVLLVQPLLMFTPRLVAAKEESLLFLGGCGQRGSEALMGQLRDRRAAGLPAEAVSGLSDFGVLYENARTMRPLPLELRHVGALALSALLPFAPLVFLVMPVQDVLQARAKLLL